MKTVTKSACDKINPEEIQTERPKAPPPSLPGGVYCWRCNRRLWGIWKDCGICPSCDVCENGEPYP